MIFIVIDDIDRDILRQLQKDSRLTQRELGRSVGLSPNAAAARVQRLTSEGVITGFHIAVDHGALGRPMQASIDVWLSSQDLRPTFAQTVQADDRITECVHLTGPVDFRIRAQVGSAEDLNDLLTNLRVNGGAQQTDSRLILEVIPLDGTTVG